jgi:hypothetical protein
LFGSDRHWIIAQLYSKLIPDIFRVVFAFDVGQISEHILDFDELRSRVSDGNLTYFSSLPLIEVIRQSAHQAELGNQDDIFFFVVVL